MRFAILTFGCRVNQADSLAIEGTLRARGAEPSALHEADVIIVNSCSVTASADQGTRQAVRRAARTNPGARIVVTGCYATRRPDDLTTLPGVARIVSNSDKDRLADLLAGEYVGALSTAERFAPEGDGPCGLHVTPGAGGRTAFLLRVQTGCDERCSYCIIPQTRGRSVSRPLEWVLEQIGRASAAGYREITLTGVHLGAYGRDLRPARSLAELLRAVAGVRFELLVRIGSLEPMDCTGEVLESIAGSARLAPAFHLPLQHASPRVLNLMRRPYTPASYDVLVRRIRDRLPDAAIGSDVIAGFPAETDEDFRAMVRFLESSPLTHLHVFPYSDRPGTEASRMKSKVDGAVVRERAAALRDVGRRLSRRFVERQAGAVRRALVIDDGSSAVLGNGLRVRLTERQRRNDWVDLRLRVEPEGLAGAPDESLRPAAESPPAERVTGAALPR